jgi:hypothetical protein
MSDRLQHMPACERRSFYPMLAYRPSVMLDLIYALRHLGRYFGPPWSVVRILEATMLVIILPLLLAYIGFQHAYWAALERFEWDWKHSRNFQSLRLEGRSIQHPSWHQPVSGVIGCFWGATFFIVGMLPYVALGMLRS